MHRNPLRLRLAVCTLAGLSLAGCASVTPQPGQQQSAAPSSQQNSNTHTDASSDNGDDTDTVPEHARWHPIPNPTNDLWIRVRNGYELAPQYGHPAIREWVAFYLSHDKHLSSSLRRARRYLWHVVDAVGARGMPMELALLPIVESGYESSAVSYSGAGGLWQFMPPTANDMGLRQTWWYDGRYDALAATDAALDYLSWLHDYFDGDWLLALAAYNAGPGRVAEALERARARGVPTNFWHLDLPRETTAYVPKLLALRRLLADPARYGLDWPQLASKPQTVEVELPAPIEMDIAADMANMPESRLRDLNPGVKHGATDPRHEGADLLVPIEKADTLRVALAQAEPAQLVTRDRYQVQPGDTLSEIAHAHNISVAALRRANSLQGERILIGQRLVLPGPGAPAQAPTKPYVVQPGDSLWQIAHRHGISLASLRRVNNLSGSVLTPGQTLQLPMTAAPETYKVHPGDTLWAIAQRYNVTLAQLREWNRLDDSMLQPGQKLAINGAAPLPDFYHVQDGDTLWAIAQRFEIQVATLRHLNDIGNRNTIRPGQRLRLRPAS